MNKIFTSEISPHPRVDFGQWVGGRSVVHALFDGHVAFPSVQLQKPDRGKGSTQVEKETGAKPEKNTSNS